MLLLDVAAYKEPFSVSPTPPPPPPLFWGGVRESGKGGSYFDNRIPDPRGWAGFRQQGCLLTPFLSAIASTTQQPMPAPSLTQRPHIHRPQLHHAHRPQLHHAVIPPPHTQQTKHTHTHAASHRLLLGFGLPRKLRFSPIDSCAGTFFDWTHSAVTLHVCGLHRAPYRFIPVPCQRLFRRRHSPTVSRERTQTRPKV